MSQSKSVALNLYYSHCRIANKLVDKLVSVGLNFTIKCYLVCFTNNKIPWL